MDPPWTQLHLVDVCIQTKTDIKCDVVRLVAEVLAAAAAAAVVVGGEGQQEVSTCHDGSNDSIIIGNEDNDWQTSFTNNKAARLLSNSVPHPALAKL